MNEQTKNTINAFVKTLREMFMAHPINQGGLSI